MAGLGDIAGLLKQAQKMQKDLDEVQERLREQVVEVSAGPVRVQVNGGMELLSIQIDPKVVDPEKTEELEELVLSAVRKGLDDARVIAKAELGKLTGGLSLPGMH